MRDFNIFNALGSISTKIMEKVAESRNNWNDFVGFHSLAALLFFFVGLPVFGFLAISADYSVLSAMFYNTSGDEVYSHRKALIFALSIFFIITIASGKICYILAKKLHRTKCLDHNDKEVDNHQVKYHKKMLSAYATLLLVALIGTGWLSMNTDQQVKEKSGGIAEGIEKDALKRDSINLNREDRKLTNINRVYENDLELLNASIESEIKAVAGEYEGMIKEAKTGIKQWQGLSKNGTDRQKKEAPQSIAYLERKISQYEAKIEKLKAPVLSRKTEKLRELQSNKAKAISVVLSASGKKDSLSTSVWESGITGLSKDVVVASKTTIGYNLGFNIVVILITRLLVHFYIGSNFGKRPAEREEKIGNQTGKKTDNQSGKKGKQKKQKATRAKEEVKDENRGATRLPASKDELKLALRAARGGRSSYKSKLANGKQTEANKNGFARYDKKVKDIEAKLDKM